MGNNVFVLCVSGELYKESCIIIEYFVGSHRLTTTQRTPKKKKKKKKKKIVLHTFTSTVCVCVCTETLGQRIE